MSNNEFTYDPHYKLTFLDTGKVKGFISSYNDEIVSFSRELADFDEHIHYGGNAYYVCNKLARERGWKVYDMPHISLNGTGQVTLYGHPDIVYDPSLADNRAHGTTSLDVGGGKNVLLGSGGGGGGGKHGDRVIHIPINDRTPPAEAAESDDLHNPYTPTSRYDSKCKFTEYFGEEVDSVTDSLGARYIEVVRALNDKRIIGVRWFDAQPKGCSDSEPERCVDVNNAAAQSDDKSASDPISAPVAKTDSVNHRKRWADEAVAEMQKLLTADSNDQRGLMRSKRATTIAHNEGVRKCMRIVSRSTTQPTDVQPSHNLQTSLDDSEPYREFTSITDEPDEGGWTALKESRPVYVSSRKYDVIAEVIVNLSTEPAVCGPRVYARHERLYKNVRQSGMRATWLTSTGHLVEVDDKATDCRIRITHWREVCRLESTD